jgi:6,7-dimethyl-8-ribityllumazine synthase
LKIIEGKLSLVDKKIAIIASRFNNFICTHLIDGAIDVLKRHGVTDEEITLIRVPGAFEIPSILKKVASTNKYNGIITLGALIRGSTPHFDYIAAEVTKGISQISLQYPIPITFGVLTCDTIEQAIERAGSKAGNKGAESAIALIEMINLYNEIEKE